MKQREKRETIFKLLFMTQCNHEEDLEQQAAVYLGSLGEEPEEPVAHPNSDEESYIQTKLACITEKLPEIDRLLNETSSGWKTSRMNKVDLSILRLAVYEMLYDDEIPTGVAINEAVEIAKRYGGDDSSSFINGILGKIARNPEASGL